jgi:DNA-binding NtrC family response regulator
MGIAAVVGVSIALGCVRTHNNPVAAEAPLVQASPLAPPAPNTASDPRSSAEGDYLAFAICDTEPKDRAAQPPPEPSTPVVEAASEVSWIRELIPLGFHNAVETFKRRLLAEAISLSEGNRAEAARRLGLQRTYLYRLTRQLAPDTETRSSSPN